MMPRTRSFLVHLVTVLVAGSLWVVAGPALPASADANATTDDSSVSVVTGSWIYSNVSTATVSNLLSSNSARLTDVEPYSTSANTWTVTMVSNSGAYAVPGWWWYVDITSAQISSFLSSNNGRLIDIEAYNDGGTIKYAVIMVSNTGTTARGWTYQVNATTAQISSNLSSNNQRLIDIEAYTTGGVTRYAAVTVTNSGTDTKAWEWFFGQTLSGVTSHVSSFGGRVIDIDRQPDGTYVFIQVKNSGTDNKYWRHHYGLSFAQVVNILTQFSVRAVDLDVYFSGSTPLYNLVAIDNASAENRRLLNLIAPSLTESNGLPRATFGFFLKPMTSSIPVSNLRETTRFEPASAVKAVHNLAVMRRVQAGSDSLSANNFIYYNYPSSSQTTGNECPNTAEETVGNRVTTTVNNGRTLMMANSDNRTTRGVVLRYGFPFVQSMLGTAGMTGSSIDQDFIGCGFNNGKRNQLTLVDFGKLYQGVQSGSLLGTGSHRTNFYAPMNGQTFSTTNALENQVINIVKAEAAAVGKSAIANTFIANMNWQWKPGGYSITCGDPFTNCSSGFYSVGTIAGQINLPTKPRGTIVPKFYVFGTYIDGLNTNCSGCVSYPNTEEQQLRAEMMRPAIKSALVSW